MLSLDKKETPGQSCAGCLWVYGLCDLALHKQVISAAAEDLVMMTAAELVCLGSKIHCSRQPSTVDQVAG